MRNSSKSCCLKNKLNKEKGGERLVISWIVREIFLKGGEK